MATPRKFSEKIALHTQKQAEETAAFEAIIKEVNTATRPPKHLPLSPCLSAYRGGSLPNVNQIGANRGIDLQTALQHLEDIKQGRPNVHPRVDRQRQIGPHRQRPFQVDKRADCSPYGPSAYLPVPPDTSWRRMYRYHNGVSLSRTHSDSALHTSAMGHAPVTPVNMGDPYGPPPSTPPTHKRIMEMVGEDSPDGLQMKGYWGDPKKMGTVSRPKSCEVPNINIYPSQELDHMGPPHIPIASNTGSLPDLTALRFPSPLSSPPDGEDGAGSSYGSSGSPSSLSPTSPHHMGMPPPANQQSPAQRRRRAQPVPSPLVLNDSSSPLHVPLSPPVDPSRLPLDPRIAQQYMLHQQRLRSHHHHHHPLHHHHHHMGAKPKASATVGPGMGGVGMGSGAGPLGPGPQVGSPSSTVPPQGHPQGHVTAGNPSQQQPSMTQYRSSMADRCQSPSSPHSVPSGSPAQSPVLPPLSAVNNSPFGEAYYMQQQQQQQQQHQQQQQQTSALQHQFEQFSMDNPSSSSMETPMVLSKEMMSSSQGLVQNTSLPFSQVVMHGLGSSIDFQQQPSSHQHQPQQQQQGLEQQQQQLQQEPVPNFFNSTDMTAGTSFMNSCSGLNMGQVPQMIPTSGSSKIPDIVLTGADDPFGRTPLDFAKELGNAITGMPDAFDTDFLTNDEAFRADLGSLDLDGLQMLTDPSMVTDPATEDTFKLDRA